MGDENALDATILNGAPRHLGSLIHDRRTLLFVQPGDRNGLKRRSRFQSGGPIRCKPKL